MIPDLKWSRVTLSIDPRETLVVDLESLEAEGSFGSVSGKGSLDRMQVGVDLGPSHSPS